MKDRIGGRKCKRYSGNHKDVVIRIRSEDQRELRFLKGILPQMNSMTPDGEVIQLLIQMYQEKRIGMLSAGKGFRMPIEKDESIDQFLDTKHIEQTLKDYEWGIQEKQILINNYIKYLDTACELGNLDKKQVMEIVQRKQKEIHKDVMV